MTPAHAIHTDRPGLSLLASRLQKPRSDGKGGFWSRCPAHDDKSPSLHAFVGENDGRLVISCKAGCKSDAVLGALGLSWRDVLGEPTAEQKLDFAKAKQAEEVIGAELRLSIAKSMAERGEPLSDADKATAIKAQATLAAATVPRPYSVDRRGVWIHGIDGDGKPIEPEWICSPLYVTALVRDKSGENWGRLIEFPDQDGTRHVWAMPMTLLAGSGEDLRRELLRLGLNIAPTNKARGHVAAYITKATPEARARCVDRTGWHGGVFVFPDRTIGNDCERVIYQAETVARHYSQAGTLDEWQDNVAALCVGNSRLVVAVSAAFAAMLLDLAGAENGGLHFVGASSTGKTSALRVACSVFGDKDYLQRWRATANGIEGLAALHSDSLLILDELAQVDARDAGEVAYMLGNGTGKTRATRTGGAKQRRTFRLLFLSAGEIGLSQHMREAGKKVRAGQEVRLVDIPADAGAGFGMFENLHGFESGAAFSKALTEAAATHYGTAAIAFLEAVSDPDTFEKLPAMLKDLTGQFVGEQLPADASGQAHRVCERFALVAAAGELAATFGITGWTQHEAERAAATCFKAWLEQRGGGGDHERQAILSQVRQFFEQHGESRFALKDATDPAKTINRCGFREVTAEGTRHFVLPEAFKSEVCAGLDARTVVKVLLADGWLEPDGDGKPQRREYLPGMGRTRCYVFSPSMWRV